MKTHYLNKIGLGALLVSVMMCFVGCATSGYRTSERTASTLQSLASRIELAGTQMDIAVTELNNLINNPQPDLRPQFDRFSAAVKKLDSLSSSMRKADADLQTRGKVHFDAWDKELTTIQNEAIRTQAQARRLEVLTQFNDVRNKCLNVQTAYAPVHSDLQDTQRFLNSDLTTAGLTAIRNTASRVTEQATPVRESVRQLVEEMRAIGIAVSPQNGMNPPPSTAK
jgi:hypothetical protein